MADRATLDVAVDRYYDAWTRADRSAFVELFAPGGTLADPPSDDEAPLSGADALAAHFDDVQSRFAPLTYERHLRWRAGHTIAVHCTVTGYQPEGAVRLPLVHVFRFDTDARLRHLDAFVDHDLGRSS